MWKEIKVVKNVSQYNFDARYGVYASTDKNKKSILYIGGKEISLMGVGHIRSFEDKVVVQVDDGASLYDAMLYTKDGELLNVVKNTLSLAANTNMRYLNTYMRDGVNYNDYNNLVDIETGKVIFKEDYLGVRFVFNDMIFSNRDNIVIRYDWDGSILWQHNYEPDFNVTIDLGFVLEGICGGKLWVESSVDSHEILLAIDVNTGELVMAFSDSEEDTYLPHCNLGKIDAFYINVENDHLLVLAYDKEYKLFMNFINAKTLEVFEKTAYAIDFDYNNGAKYLMGVSGFYGDFITLNLECLHVDGDTSGFAIYNYKKKEVLFSHRLFTPEQTRKGLYVFDNANYSYYNNGLFFVLDSCNTLHIFEDVKE